MRLWKKLDIRNCAAFRLLLQQEEWEADTRAVELESIVRMYHAMIDELPKLPYILY